MSHPRLRPLKQRRRAKLMRVSAPRWSPHIAGATCASDRRVANRPDATLRLLPHRSSLAACAARCTADLYAADLLMVMRSRHTSTPRCGAFWRTNGNAPFLGMAHLWAGWSQAPQTNIAWRLSLPALRPRPEAEGSSAGGGVSPHIHHESRTCVCSMQALEPDEQCPIHGTGEWPPRCEVCGCFMPYPEYDENGKLVKARSQ